VPAHLSADLDVKGGLAAFAEGRADVQVASSCSASPPEGASSARGCCSGNRLPAKPWMYTPPFLDASGTLPSHGRLDLVLDTVEAVMEDAAALGWVAQRDLESAAEDLAVVRQVASARPLSRRDAEEICHRLVQACFAVTVHSSSN
jgi:hypothetical protein